MARTTNYGLGQYRFNKEYSYIGELQDSTIEYYSNESYGSTKYQDILVTLPVAENGSTPLIQYGKTYYIELTVPQNQEYTTTIDLKLCAATTINQNSAPDLNRFQNIKRLIVPPTPNPNDKIHSPVLLFESPETQNIKDNPETPEKEEEKEIILAAVIEDYIEGMDLSPYHVYKYNNQYFYCYENLSSSEIWDSISGENGGEKSSYFIKNKNVSTLIQTWKVSEGNESTVTYKFAFSPKYNLEGGYKYLLIETNRENGWSQTMQWINDNGETYYGTTLDIASVNFKIYSVSNLLERNVLGQSQIQSSTGQLTHIGIWGHPEQAFTINGEEIKIGQSGFYELNDYIINDIGVIVTDKQVDRFTIDYEYKVVN